MAEIMTDDGFDLDADLISRYGVSGPRYTSYPTALQFTERFGERQYCLRAKHSGMSGAPLSIYVHLPFCHSICYFCACTKIVTQHRSRSGPYIANVIREAELAAEKFNARRPVTQLHLGGGTPTFCSDAELEDLLTNLRRLFNFSDDCECSIEIDPRTVDPERIGALSRMGFNRLSMGVQDFDPDVQRAINRIQTPEKTTELIQAARRYGFDSVSVDLIYGLPFQSQGRFDKTINQVVDAAPDRISLYSYAHLPHRFKAQRLIKEETLPQSSEKVAILAHSIRRLSDAGYVYIGMDHFARADDELALSKPDGGLHRNFQGYSTRAECDLIGLGVSAISRFGGCFSQNVKNTRVYSRMLDDGFLPVERGLMMSEDDKLRAGVIQAIMCEDYVSFAEFEQAYNIDFCTYFAAELDELLELQKDGLVDIHDLGFDITPRGRLLLRVVAMPFDAYLNKRGVEQQYSKVI